MTSEALFSDVIFLVIYGASLEESQLLLFIKKATTMADDRDIVRAHSQDKQIYRHSSTSVKRQTSTQFRQTTDNYYSNRNCPEILSLFALKNRHLEDREKQIAHSLSNDDRYFNTINYPIQSSTATPTPNLVPQNVLPETKETKFPQLTPRRASSTVKKFPDLTLRATSIVTTKSPMPTIRTIRTTVKSTSSSTTTSSMNKPLQAKAPTVFNEKRKQSQPSHYARQSQK